MQFSVSQLAIKIRLFYLFKQKLHWLSTFFHTLNWSSCVGNKATAELGEDVPCLGLCDWNWMILKVLSYPSQFGIVWIPIWHEGEGDCYTFWCVLSVSANSCTKLCYFSSCRTSLHTVSTIFKKQIRFVLILQVWGENTSAAAVSKGNASSPEGKDTQDLLGSSDPSRNNNVNSTCPSDPICFPRGLDFPNPQAIPCCVPSQMNPTFVQCMAGSFARWCLSRGRPAGPRSAGWTSPSAAPSAGSRSHPGLSPPGYFS